MDISVYLGAREGLILQFSYCFYTYFAGKFKGM